LSEYRDAFYSINQSNNQIIIRKMKHLSILILTLVFAACSEPKNAQTETHAYVCKMPVQHEKGIITALSGVVYIEQPGTGFTQIYEIGKNSDTLADYAGYSITFTSKGTTLLGVAFETKQTSYAR
jgi:hypothetical protein